MYVPQNINTHAMNTRNPDKFKVTHANTERLKISNTLHAKEIE